jgi:hypothetical protein
MRRRTKGKKRRRGKAGEAGRRRGRPAAARPGEEGLEVGDGPDRWAPPVGGCVRERGREAGAGGPAWAESGELGRDSKKKKREGRMGWAGVGKG